MKNKITDVTNILIEQLERLNDEEVCCNKSSVKNEIDKAHAMVELSHAIVENRALQLKALSIITKSNIQVPTDNVLKLLEI